MALTDIALKNAKPGPKTLQVKDEPGCTLRYQSKVASSGSNPLSITGMMFQILDGHFQMKVNRLEVLGKLYKGRVSPSFDKVHKEKWLVIIC